MMAAKKQRRQWKLEVLETGEPEPVEEYPAEKRVVSGSVWMLVVTLVLFIVPVANGIIGGVIGGYRVGSPRNALMSALGPVFLSSCFLWIIYSLWPIDIFGGPLTQIGALGVIVLTDLGMLLGAAIGGSVASSHGNRLNRA